MVEVLRKPSNMFMHRQRKINLAKWVLKYKNNESLINANSLGMFVIFDSNDMYRIAVRKMLCSTMRAVHFNNPNC